MGLIHHHGLLVVLKKTPVFSFTTDKTSGETITFTLRTNPISDVLWDFGDGNYGTSSNSAISHVYSISGDKLVSATFDKALPVSEIRFETTKIKGLLNLSGINSLVPGSIFTISNNPNLFDIAPPLNYGDTQFFYFFNNTGYATSLNLPGLVRVTSLLRIYGNTLMTGIEFPALKKTQNLEFYLNPVVQNLDLPAIDESMGSARISQNDNLISIGLPNAPTINGINIYLNPLLNSINISKLGNLGGGNLFIYQNATLPALDLSSINTPVGYLSLRDNPNLINLTLPTGYDLFRRWETMNTPLNMTLPFGTSILANINNIDNNSQNQTNINANINNVYQNRNNYTVSVAKQFSAGGNNAAPGGIYQAPSGYIQATTGITGNDGTPASAKEQIFVLMNQNNDGETTKKYNWNFIVIGGL